MLIFLLAACPAPDSQDTSIPKDTADTADTADTGDSGDTGDTADTSDTADTTDTGDTTDTTDTGDTGDTTDTSDTSDTAAIVTTFVCTETSMVDPYMKVEITGGFDAATVPYDVMATKVSGGAVEVYAAVGQVVDAADPYYADVAYWEAYLHMTGWNVGPPPDGSGEGFYVFFPDGAEGVSTFNAFYYHIYADGAGNGQFDFDCLPV